MKWVAVVFATVASLWVAGPVLAQQYPPSPSPGGGAQGAGEERGGAARGAGEEAGAGQEAEAGELAFTGADLTMYVVIGMVAVGSGILILRRTRATKADG